MAIASHKAVAILMNVRRASVLALLDLFIFSVPGRSSRRRGRTQYPTSRG
jgi:hypothetical protein